MFIKNTLLAYPALLITSTKKSFAALGRKIKATGKTISKTLRDHCESYGVLENLAVKKFANKKELVLVFDETLIKKIYSRLMEGTGYFYDTGLFRRIMAYKLLAALLTDGSLTLPLSATFLFTKELVPNSKEDKSVWIKKIIMHVKGLFPKTRIIIAADGAFASKEFLRWCVDNGLPIEVRMRSNCRVDSKGVSLLIRDIKSLKPKGRQMARTIAVLWHGIPLFITAQRRIDKNGKETVVFQAATFKAKPMRHVTIYRCRWTVELMFRTIKQNLGLQQCLSRKIEMQRNHVASVLLAYALVQCDSQNRKLPNPEAALKNAELKKGPSLKRYISRLDNIINNANA